MSAVLAALVAARDALKRAKSDECNARAAHELATYRLECAHEAFTRAAVAVAEAAEVDGAQVKP